MRGNSSALYSKYIIDGVPKDLNPAQILNSCLHEGTTVESVSKDFDDIVDESCDPEPAVEVFQGLNVRECLEKMIPLLGTTSRDFPMSYAGPYTKAKIAKALLDCLWMKGNFKLSDLSLDARWKWSTKPLGNMAGFYSSVEAAAEYVDGLGIDLTGYSFSESERFSRVDFKVEATVKDQEFDDLYDLPGDAPFGSEHPAIGRTRAIPSKLVKDPDSWIIYIPFDSCDFRLGYSLLCKAIGRNSDTFPELGDADYFIDCFEVVREFVEDKVAVSATTVFEGGLLSALKLMCPEGVGAAIDVSGIMNAYGEKNVLRVLFSEVPGALLQVPDAEYDYVDAEFLLQDIAYYPIGHPLAGKDKISVKAGGGSKISDILQSLLRSQTTEGED